MKHIAFVVEMERVTCVGSALETSDYIITGSEHVDNFTFAFVAPLQTENYINLFHSESLILPPKIGVFAWKTKPTAIFLHFLLRSALLGTGNAFGKVVCGSVSSFKKTCYLCGRFQAQ